jgi:hypothetical protein
MYTIKVIEERTGQPANYKKVSVRYTGLLGAFEKDQRTDRNGEVHYSHENANAEVYIDGKSYGKYDLSGRVVIYI